MRVTPFFLTSLLLTAASIDQGGVQNAAPWNNGQGLIAPGQIIMISGSGFAPFGTEASFKSFPVPTNLAGVQVRFDSVYGAIYYASPNQINVQVPYTVTGTNVTLTVLYNGNVVAVTTVKTTVQQPGLFTYGPEPIVTDPAGRLVGTTGRDPIAIGPTGAFIVLYGSGFGPTNPSFFPGEPAPLSPVLLYRLVTNIKSAKMDGRELNILYAGLTPGSVGLYQLNIELPAGTPAGVHKLALNIGGVDIPEFIVTTK